MTRIKDEPASLRDRFAAKFMSDICLKNMKIDGTSLPWAAAQAWKMADNLLEARSKRDAENT